MATQPRRGYLGRRSRILGSRARPGPTQRCCTWRSRGESPSPAPPSQPASSRGAATPTLPGAPACTGPQSGHLAATLPSGNFEGTGLLRDRLTLLCLFLPTPCKMPPSDSWEHLPMTEKHPSKRGWVSRGGSERTEDTLRLPAKEPRSKPLRRLLLLVRVGGVNLSPQGG